MTDTATQIETPPVATTEAPPVGPGHPPVEHQFQPGVSGNPNGRPKGRKNLATLIRDLEDEGFDWDKVPGITDEDRERFNGRSPFEVIIAAAMKQAVMGDQKAREWLRKAGYGDKLDVTTDGRAIQTPAIISVIGARNVAVEAQTTDSN